MPENTPTPAPSLQFDKAEYSGSQEAASLCSACKSPITQSYYTANAAIVCDRCRGQYQAFLTGGSRFERVFAATALGLLAGLAGAAVWYAVRRLTGYEIGLIAIVVGLMVGVAVRKGSKGRGGWFYQTLAIVLTYSCICAQYMPDVVEALLKFRDSPPAASAQAKKMPSAVKSPDKAVAENAAGESQTPKRGPVNMTLVVAVLLVVAFAISLAAPFLSGVQNLIGLLIIGFALYEAWKINKRSVVRIAGPFQLGPAAACGTIVA